MTREEKKLREVKFVTKKVNNFPDQNFTTPKSRESLEILRKTKRTAGSRFRSENTLALIAPVKNFAIFFLSKVVNSQALFVFHGN